MSEGSWNPEPAPKKKRRIPLWIWGCGAGCLGFLLTCLILVPLVWRALSHKFEEMRDPEQAWPVLQEYLAFEERPAGYDPMYIDVVGQQQITITAPDQGMVGILFLHDAGDEAATGVMLDADSPANRGVFDVGRIREPQRGEVLVQGRPCQSLRFYPWIPQREIREHSAPSIRIDLGDYNGRRRLLQLTRTFGADPISDEEVELFLEPFDPWRTP